MSTPTPNDTVITTPPVVAEPNVPPPAGAESNVPPPVGSSKTSENRQKMLKNFYLHHGALGGGRGL